MDLNHGVHRQHGIQAVTLARIKPFHVLLPICNLNEAEFMLTLAEAIVNDRDGQLLILYDIHTPQGEPICKSAAVASLTREALGELLSKQSGISARIKAQVRVRSSIWESIWDTVASENIDLVLFALPSPSLSDTLFTNADDVRLHASPCDLVIVLPPSGHKTPDLWKSVKQILMPVRGGPGSTLTLRVGHAIAQQIGADISVLHVAQPKGGKENLRFVEEFSPAMHGLERVTRLLTAKGDLGQSIMKEADGHQMLVMGAPTKGGQIDSHIPWLDESSPHDELTLILVKEGKNVDRGVKVEEKTIKPKIDRPVAVVVDKWFAENTYQSREFEDLASLVRLKEEQNISISLGLPALNEEATVGQVIQSISNALIKEVPLLDEMVLIDSNSVDNTRKVAEDLGIPVYIHQEILPQYGHYHGKGEALWKSLYVLKGDIIAWIDTDIRNIHPRFVYGILGPLLSAPSVQYVKGFYQRPLKQGDKLVAGGGGRVTELTARPLINLFFPDLSGVIQPLSGEYAGRRSALEQVPFFTGYGVETGLLIDLFHQFGLKGIAQVDLLERIHRNQGLGSLSKMSFAIIQVFHNRLGARDKTSLFEEANLTMNKIIYGARNYYLEAEEICEHERPPMISIPEYRQVFDRWIKDDIENDEVNTISSERTAAYPVRYPFNPTYPRDFHPRQIIEREM